MQRTLEHGQPEQVFRDLFRFRDCTAGPAWSRDEMGRNPSLRLQQHDLRPRRLGADARHRGGFCNDREGIEVTAAASEFRRVWPVLRGPAASLIAIGLKDQSGRFLPGLIVGDRWFVIGEEGRRYAIVVQNRSDLRLEAVLSVDGLDVLDGHPASVRKRGYVIDPHRTLVVDGFRQSADSVAAFRLSPVRESYAQEKYRNTRNVGVIGVAIFNERGTYPWTDREVKKRLRANPFPNRFATSPNE